MLEKPNLADKEIVARMQEDYGLRISQIDFLPLGVDRNTAVYRAMAEDQRNYFVKVRKGNFDEIAVRLPKYLSEQGVKQIIAPIATKTGHLYTDGKHYKMMLYPFVAGCNAYETKLTNEQWIDFGNAIRCIHNKPVPSELREKLPVETFSASEGDKVLKALERVRSERFDEAIVKELAALLNSKNEAVSDLIERTKRLARALRLRAAKFVICHADLLAGNILIDESGQLFIVDWDGPIWAPKERDLMYAGGGQFGADRPAEEEEALFYEGYGQTLADPVGLAYYRYERIIDDIAAFCEQIFDSQDGEQDREQALGYLRSIFLPGNTLEIASQAEHARPKPGESSRV